MKIVNTDKKIIDQLRKSGLSKKMKSLESCDFLAIEEKDGKIVGAGGVGGLFNVPSLQIDDQFQGKGIGKNLLGVTLEEAKKRGYSFISGSRNPENIRAIKIHDFYGFYPIFRIHYTPSLVRDIIILILKPKGNLAAKFFCLFNNIIGTTILALVLKVTKPLFTKVLTYPPEEFPKVSIRCMIKNFEKLSKIKN